MTNQTTNQSARPDWIGLARAKMHLENLVRQQEGIIENTTDAMGCTQRHLADYIETARWGEKATAQEIERASRMMADYQRDLDRHTALRDAYRAAAAIIDASSGAYFYAAHEGWYSTDLAKFETEEERAAFLEGNERWHAATGDDMNYIFWGNTLPTDGAPEA